MITRGRRYSRGLLEESQVTSDPALKRSHDFLVGVWVLIPLPQQGDADDLTQPIAPAEAERLEAFLSSYPGVTGIRELLVNFIGPGRVWVVARVDIDNDLRGDQVESLVRGIESGMRHESENIHRVDIVPIGGEGDGGLG